MRPGGRSGEGGHAWHGPTRAGRRHRRTWRRYLDRPDRAACRASSPVLIRLAPVPGHRPRVFLDALLLLLLQRLQDLAGLLLGHLPGLLLLRGAASPGALLRLLLRVLVLFLVLLLLFLLLLLLLLVQEAQSDLEVAFSVGIIRPGAQCLNVRLDRFLRPALHQEGITTVVVGRLRKDRIGRGLGPSVLLDCLVVLFLAEQD